MYEKYVHNKNITHEDLELWPGTVFGVASNANRYRRTSL